MSTLSQAALGTWSAQSYGRLPGCYYIAQMSFLNGVYGPSRELPGAFRKHRQGRMRLMCYARHYQQQGGKGLPLPKWRMPRHPLNPRRSPPGQQQELRFDYCL